MKIVPPSIRLLHATPDPEKVIEAAGRLCWKSEGRITEDSHIAFIQTLKISERRHESVLEHASAGFIVTTDRGVSDEMVRHRLASYSQTSTRYRSYGLGKFGGEITVVKPADLPEEGPAFEIWKASCLEAEKRYLTMLEAGQKPQTARSVLPTCLMTEIAISANFREWRHFLSLRCTSAAHPDMRIVAYLIRDELVRLAPTVFEEWAPVMDLV